MPPTLRPPSLLLLGALLLPSLALGLGGCSTEEAKHKAAGNVLFRKGELGGAEREYRAALQANDRDPNAHTLLGNALFEQGKLDQARAAYERALALDPAARAATQGLVNLHLRQGDRAAARALLERLVAQQPSDSEAHSALGKLLYATRDLEGAEKHLRETLVYAQNDPAALYTLGLVLAKKREQAQANAVFDRLERVAPGQAYTPYGRGVAAAAAGEAEEALKWLAVALEKGIEDLDQVEKDEAWSALRATPRFVELIASARTRAPPKKGSPGP